MKYELVLFKSISLHMKLKKVGLFIKENGASLDEWYESVSINIVLQKL